MANLTSDLADVLVDGENSMILADAGLEALASKVSQALSEPYNFDRGAIAADAKAIFAPVQHAQLIHDFIAVRLATR